MSLQKLFTAGLFSLFLFSALSVSAVDYVTVNGNVLYDGDPVCALVLANGQKMFTCSGDGSFELSVPLDTNGQITLFGFVAGLAPFKAVLMPAEAANYIINMEEDAGSPEFEVISSSHPSTTRDGWVDVSGTIDWDGTPVCGLILANGQHMFSCGSNLGVFDLEVPLDGNGQVTLFAFVAGFQPFKEIYGAIIDDANAFYVAPDGDDTSPGTETEPWKTIQKAANTLTAGQTVYIRTGTYNEQVTPQNSGTAGQVITYAAYPGETPVLDGTGVVLGTFEGLFYVAGSDANNTINYITVSGLKVQNVGGQFLGVTPPDPEADEFPDHNYNGIMVEYGSHITIKNNITYNTVSSGISAWTSNNIVIDGNEVELACNDGEQECISVDSTDTFSVINNTVHDSAVGTGKIGGEGICLKNGSKNGIVSGNTVHHVSRLGIYLDAWNTETHNIRIFNNIVHDNTGDGLTAASEDGGLLHDIHFYNNLVYNNQNNGVTIAAHGNDVASHPIQDIYFVNNTFYNNGTVWGGCVSVENPDITNIVIRNNICSQNHSFQIQSDVSTTPLVVDHNLCDGQKEDSEPSTEFQGTDVVSASPLFVNVTAGSEDFHLLATSPAIDQGTATGAPTDDFSGTARPIGQSMDIGAFEYNP